MQPGRLFPFPSKACEWHTCCPQVLSLVSGNGLTRMKIETCTRKLTRLRKVANHVDAHLDQPLSLDDLADIAHLSRFHFERVFSEYSGEAPVARVRRLRLALARRRIESGENISMLELALDSGYGSAEAFSRAFRACHGQPPSRLPRTQSTPVAIQIRRLSGVAIQYIPFRGRLDEGIAPFDELRAHAMLAGIPRERRKGWCVQVAGELGKPGSELELQAALLSERLGQRIDGLEQGFLPDGEYAVLPIEGGFTIPDDAALARRIETETGRRLLPGAPRLRCFNNASYLPADFERRFELYVPVQA